MVLRKVEIYLRAKGISATAFGRQVARDPRLVHDMRKGRELGERLTHRIETFIGEGR